MLGIYLLLLSNLAPLVKNTQFEYEKNKCINYLPKVQGWCSVYKADRLMDLIYQVKPKVCVEVGVFGGSSIWPQACALKFNRSGVIYAIDPWDKAACCAGYDADDDNYAWWQSVDLEGIYRGFTNLINNAKLNDYVHTLRLTSKDALSHFAEESIDILHIDGNHTKDYANSDAVLYFPKVKQGGYIIFDDINWCSTSEARDFLFRSCEYIPEFSDNTFGVFRKN